MRGRPKGAANKNKDRLLRIIQDEYGEDFNPIMIMCGIAADETNETSARFNACKEIAPYLYPKLKSVEVDLTADFSVSDMSVEEIKARLKELDDVS